MSNGAGDTKLKSGVCVFSGGTAANFLVDVFNQIVDKRECPLNYIIPISDNGGSSSEIIRVFGGPSKYIGAVDLHSGPPFGEYGLTAKQVLVIFEVSQSFDPPHSGGILLSLPRSPCAVDTQQGWR